MFVCGAVHKNNELYKYFIIFEQIYLASKQSTKIARYVIPSS
jgi:hypothetical protein